MSYYDDRIFTELGFTKQYIKIEAEAIHDGVQKTVKIDQFKKHKEGIEIIVTNIKGELIYVDHKDANPERPNINNNRSKPFSLLRYETPKEHINSKGKKTTKKYHIPAKAGTFPFFPKNLVQKFKDKKKIKTLVLTEGYFKAAKADFHGLDCVGLSSITHVKNKETQKMYADIIQLIQICDVQNVVILWDADCIELREKDIAEKKDLAFRPENFLKQVRTIRELLIDYSVNIYFAHVYRESFPDKPKGLDDLLVAAKGKEKDIVQSIQSISQPSEFIFRLDVTRPGKALNNYFSLGSADTYYTEFKELIKEKEFVFQGSTWKYNWQNEKLEKLIPEKAKNIVRIGNHYYETIEVPNEMGKPEKKLMRRDKTNIIDDFGKNIIKNIRKFKSFCIIPSHTDYKPYLLDCYNLYFPFEHEPEPGECNTIIDFLKHIFRGTVQYNGQEISRLDMALDYIQLLYQNPTQKLPVLCLVSEENQTGKSTFVDFLKMIFTNNMAKIGNDDLQNQFNFYWAGKLIIACEETIIEKRSVMEKVKALSTSDKITVNRKGADHEEMSFFGKFIFCSNHEDNFMFATKYDTRYWVIKCQQIEKKNPNLLQEMKDEIQSFLFFLSMRTMVTKKEDRMWFHRDMIMTDALQKVIDYSKSKVEKEIQTKMKELFFEFGDTQILMSTHDINHEFFNNRVERNYLNRVLSKNMELERYTKNNNPVQRYSYPKWELNLRKQWERVDINRIGRAYIFKIEDFLTKDEIKTRNNEVSESEATKQAHEWLNEPAQIINGEVKTI